MSSYRAGWPRFTIRKLLALVACVCAVGAAYAIFQRDYAALPGLYGGAENLGIVRNPEKVEAFRLAELPEEALEEYRRPWEFKAVGKPIALPTGVAKEVSAVLTSASSFDWENIPKSCGYPVYGVRMDFLRASERIQIYFCFKCADLAVVVDGNYVGAADFHRADQLLARAVKKLFPDDAVIQGLRE